METLTRTAPTADAPDVQVRPLGAWATQAALVAVGGYVAIASRSLGVWTEAGPGPGFFPLVLGLFLVVLSLVWFVQTPRQVAPASASQRTLLRTGAVTIGSLVLLAAVLNVVGFQIAMFAFLLFHLRRGRVRWLASVIIALVGSVGTFHLFGDVLLVPLPLSSLPFLGALGV
ncbi:tripartite tricarboxylate transporter TctB family protein [Knoellia koreensis]|uniref:Tripartite tricarboxylate transporter TctB family protein n=1 Tax=Knoellia koreensis TaxID=2730921 RepID=A0A849HHS3_9MICO|nr:tripartite tricarboxylate transporter TctB family protein [Knoellia sp. DB2414S]NNM46762.1 tripartite tricarboxylate transporter TctB family protein [Knoellia sp. DB2414S]